MPLIEIELSLALKKALDDEAARSNQSTQSLIAEILSRHTDVKLHTVFQVSTSGALVAGVYDKEVTVGALLEHGNFGLGTFAGLDGEMVVLDGHVYQAHASGKVTEAGSEVGAPFAVVTEFTPDKNGKVEAVASFDDLGAKCDCFRSSNNIFHALRLHGRYKRIKARAVSPPEPGTSLVEAAKAQSEFVFNDVTGTLVGIWSPAFSAQFSVEGYHFHFISDDHTQGGHVLDVEADFLDLQVETLNDFRLILPESEEFLKADLSKDIAAELNSAERSH
ncbi:acetolactate decarboxylase [Ancylobacter terrae]|uniref:acetolactate decarboxylase n=1 Tax=Ancylobacter sp. sgz301288 TaxID=3342077 RepID=UPI00385E6DAF